MSEILFTVPDIYPDFKCKISSCRQNCCLGWEITVSMKDYFHLLGMNCPRALRRRLDGALYILDHPSPERYAAFVKTFDGDCPMHDPDGFCALQRGCGENALSAVCRYYPRSPRTIYANECALSASCEGVTELLFSKKEPLGFIKIPLGFDIPLPEHRSGVTAENYESVRRMFIAVMQDRTVSLITRLEKAGDFAEKLDAPFIAGNRDDIRKAIRDCFSDITYETHAVPEETDISEVLALTDCFDTHNAIYPYIEEAKKNLGITGACPDCNAEIRQAYFQAQAYFANVFPEWERMFEQILVNHIFYTGFPFENEHKSIFASWSALCTVFDLWRFVAVGYTLSHAQTASLADLTAAMFRLAENSDFAFDASLNFFVKKPKDCKGRSARPLQSFGASGGSGIKIYHAKRQDI